VLKTDLPIIFITIKPWLVELRILHWVKNVFVFAPLVFSGQLFRADSFIKSSVLFMLFCMLSSSVYLFNDIIDLKKDQEHPQKKMRPIAMGLIPISSAWMASLILAGSGLFMSLLLHLNIFAILLCYIANNLLYSFFLRNVTIADVISISVGFMLRLIGGAFVINVELSRWLLMCGFALSLFLAFGKRRVELESTGHSCQNTGYRNVLSYYNKDNLNNALSITNALSICTYLLFVTDPSTIILHHTNELIYTAPLVVYCLFRYMFKVQEGKGTGPVDILIKDSAFLSALFLWLMLVLFIIYIT